MTRTLTSSALAFGLLILASSTVGCANDPVGAGLNTLEGAFTNICNTCPATLGQPSSTACLAASETFLPSATEEMCIRTVYNNHAAELQPVFDCFTRTYQAFDTCIRGAIATSCPPSMDDQTVCTNMLMMASCPMPSETTSAELDACTPPSP